MELPNWMRDKWLEEIRIYKDGYEALCCRLQDAPDEIDDHFLLELSLLIMSIAEQAERSNLYFCRHKKDSGHTFSHDGQRFFNEGLHNFTMEKAVL